MSHAPPALSDSQLDDLAQALMDPSRTDDSIAAELNLHPTQLALLADSPDVQRRVTAHENFHRTRGNARQRQNHAYAINELGRALQDADVCPIALLAKASAASVLTISTIPPAASFLAKLASGAKAVLIGRGRVVTPLK